MAKKNATFIELLKKADSVQCDAVRAISDLIVKPGIIGLDFADVRMVMREMGLAMLGIGQAGGGNRAIRAMEAAVNSPLLNEFSISAARRVLISITAPLDITMDELEDVSNYIREMTHEDADIIWGCVEDKNLGNDVRITIFAGGMEKHDNDYLPLDAA